MYYRIVNMKQILKIWVTIQFMSLLCCIGHKFITNCLHVRKRNADGGISNQIIKLQPKIYSSHDRQPKRWIPLGNF